MASRGGEGGRVCTHGGGVSTLLDYRTRRATGTTGRSGVREISGDRGGTADRGAPALVPGRRRALHQEPRDATAPRRSSGSPARDPARVRRLRARRRRACRGGPRSPGSRQGGSRGGAGGGGRWPRASSRCRARAAAGSCSQTLRLSACRAGKRSRTAAPAPSGLRRDLAGCRSVVAPPDRRPAGRRRGGAVGLIRAPDLCAEARGSGSGRLPRPGSSGPHGGPKRSSSAPGLAVVGFVEGARDDPSAGPS